MQVEMRAVGDIKPYKNNPRHNDAGVEAVAQSIKEFGFNQPIVVDRHGVIIVGDTRYRAALLLGLSLVPVYVAANFSEAQAKAYRIADNQTATYSSFDEAKLIDELVQLQSLNYDLGQTGFTAPELDHLLSLSNGGPQGDPDSVPEPPDVARTQLHDSYVLGNHRLYCGDAAQWPDVKRLIEDHEISLVHTDPPYNVRVEPRSNNAIAAGNSSFKQTSKRKRTHHQSFDVARQGKKQATHRKLRAKDRPLANDFVSVETYAGLLDAWFGHMARALKPGGVFYLWGGYANVGNYPPALKKHGLYFSQAIIWHKLHPVLTRKDFMGDHEWCFYGWKEGAAHKFYGPNNVTDLWQVKKVNPQSMVHLTEKPVELATRAMEYSSQPGDYVLDLFSGSGSTLIGAELTGRRALLMEIDPLYCDVIVQRWETFSGKTAERLPLAQVA